MALPDTVLVVKLDAAEWTLGDARLLTGRLNSNPIEMFAQFGDFLVAHTNWSQAEVDRITTDELRSVIAQVQEFFEEQSVPLANAAPSAAGPG